MSSREREETGIETQGKVYPATRHMMAPIWCPDGIRGLTGLQTMDNEGRGAIVVCEFRRV